jgi:ribosomal protein S6
MSEKDIKEIGGSQAYELGFHLVPTLGDDEVGKAFDKVTKLIEKVGGTVISKSEPALLNLEYQMEKTVDSVKSKYNTAYFAWVIFEGGDVETLGEEIETDKDVLRQLLIKTDQKDSINSSEVAAIINGDVEEETTEEVEKSETEEKVEKTEEVKEEVSEEKVEETEEKTSDDKVDEAIDELVKE